MSRNLDSSLSAALRSNSIVPVLLADLTFKSGVSYCWTGIGNLAYNGNTYTGIGNLGRISAISEGSSVKADGIEVTLSGVGYMPLQTGGTSAVALAVNEAMSDYKMGGAAKIRFGLLNNGVLIGSPYLIFSGQMDQPSIDINPVAGTITIAIENKLSNLLRPTARRYTAADQHIQYPNDTGFNFVEMLNDVALRWHT
jgi:hypothetical protein